MKFQLLYTEGLYVHQVLLSYISGCDYTIFIIAYIATLIWKLCVNIIDYGRLMQLELNPYFVTMLYNILVWVLIEPNVDICRVKDEMKDETNVSRLLK